MEEAQQEMTPLEKKEVATVNLKEIVSDIQDTIKFAEVTANLLQNDHGSAAAYTNMMLTKLRRAESYGVGALETLRNANE